MQLEFCNVSVFLFLSLFMGKRRLKVSLITEKERSRTAVASVQVLSAPPHPHICVQTWRNVCFEYQSQPSWLRARMLAPEGQSSLPGFLSLCSASSAVSAPVANSRGIKAGPTWEEAKRQHFWKYLTHSFVTWGSQHWMGLCNWIQRLGTIWQ